MRSFRTISPKERVCQPRRTPGSCGWCSTASATSTPGGSWTLRDDSPRSSASHARVISARAGRPSPSARHRRRCSRCSRVPVRVRRGSGATRSPTRGGSNARSAVSRSSGPAGTAIWDDLESSGTTFSILNVAFRRDRVWSDAVREPRVRLRRVPEPRKVAQRRPARRPHAAGLPGHRARGRVSARRRRAASRRPAPGAARARRRCGRCVDARHARLCAPAHLRRAHPVPREPGRGPVRSRGARGARPSPVARELPRHVRVPPGAPSRRRRRTGSRRCGARPVAGRGPSAGRPRAMGVRRNGRALHDLLPPPDRRGEPLLDPPLGSGHGRPPHRPSLREVRRR